MILAAVLALGRGSADAGSLRVTAFDAKGNSLDRRGLLAYIAPAEKEKAGVSPAESGLFLTDEAGRPLPGRPWWDERSDGIVWRWEGERILVSLPWPILKDGFSTVLLDNGGKGFVDGQSVLLNEEIAQTAYRRMQDSLKLRMAAEIPYQPARPVLKMVDEAKAAIAAAHGADGPRKKAALFDKALTLVSYAWQQMLFDHGKQNFSSEKVAEGLRFGLSIDESLYERVHDFERIADQLAASGATWVRLVFPSVPGDFTFSSGASFALYDRFVELLTERKIRILGSVLDSLLWPSDLTPEAYSARATNLVERYKDRIRSWEIASEPNARWLGGTNTPLSDETILLCVQKGVVAVKKADRALETVATLHWWEGTAGDDRHPTFSWLDWSVPRGFGQGIDLLALSVYPHRHPLGIAFEPAFAELHRRFPGKKLMVGGFSFADGKKLDGYWWYAPDNVKDARKDLLVLFMGASAAIPNGVGGGFFWPTLRLMLPADKKPTELYRVHKDSLDSLRR